jgi:hypothetical protein
MALSGWTVERVREFEQLVGQRIDSWTGVEMALREETAAGGPQFEDPTVPCLQLNVLGALFQDGTFMNIGTYQNDSVWGLCLRRAATDPSAALADRDRIYRRRILSELPTGEVDGVATFLAEDVLAEVVLKIQDRPLLLMAGELAESLQGRLTFVRYDESVLAFTDPSEAELVAWVPERRGLIQS